MASVSVAAGLTAHPPFDAPSDLPLRNKSAHARRTSRNSQLTPLPAFTFNPGSADQMPDARDPAARPGEKESAHQPARRSPPPLPAFSFNPGAAVASEVPLPSPTHPVLEEMAQNKSRSSSRPAVLPAFSFNSSASEAPKTPSPTKSSFAQDTPSSARSMRHRRRESDLIGGAERAALSVTPSGASPQKDTPGLHVNSYGPPRFSHQHRRSQAVSITEIETSELIKANAISKHRAACSMPPTPTDPLGQSISSLCDTTLSSSSPRRASTSAGRPRVGFSDSVDVIPRPLSMISSETEDSTSTVRGGHSLTGSITSLGSPAPRSVPSPSHDENIAVPRPQTADAPGPCPPAKLDLGEPTMTSNVPPRPHSASDLVNFPASSTSSANKKRFWFTSGSVEPSLKNTPIQTPTAENTPAIPSLTSVVLKAERTVEPTQVTKTQERRAGIKKRKVRTIAGAIFSHRTHSRQAPPRARRMSTPPSGRTFASDSRDTVFDEDNTLVISDPPSSIQEQQQQVPMLVTDTLSHGATFSREPHTDVRVMSPVLDLDAALGPFGSEAMLPHNGFAAARGRMHSSTGVGASNAFGILHRRTESAPQMPPVNKSLVGLHRLGSNSSAVEDVFDEEEENDFLAEENKPAEESQEGSELIDTGRGPEASADLVPNAAPQPGDRASSRSPIRLTISTKAPDGIEIVDAEDLTTREAARSSDSTLTASVLSDNESKQPVQSSMTFAYPAPQTSYASSGEGRSLPSSAIPSPDADHIVFDGGSRFYRYVGETSLEFGVCSSTEDVPSLCNSECTGAAPRGSSGANTRSSADQRSTSLSAAHTLSGASTPRSAWKRASIASLNKFVPGSSHSDRSRLRFEESAEHERETKLRKKGNRISRLMTFWRSKEKENT